MDVAVHGARGYLGRELVRLLLQHPRVDHVYPVSSSQVGDAYESHVPGFARCGLSFHAADAPEVLASDVVFLALHGGAAAPLIAAHEAAAQPLVIDLSRDTRLEGIQGKQGWSYGLADWTQKAATNRIANPGCYPTATLLGLAPLLAAGLLGQGVLIVDGKSGVSGAGAAPREDLHFPAMNESVRAYKVTGHDHSHEIQAYAEVLASAPVSLRFTPHLVPQTRGLLTTSYVPLKLGVTAEEVKEAYTKVYASHPGVQLVDEADTAHVRNTNQVQIATTYDKDNHLVIVRSAIDNIQKGGAGTAIQNMNLGLGLDPYTGLQHYGGNL